MLVDKIQEWATAEAERRPATARIGAHNCGKCVRANWYSLHGAPAETLTGRAILTFDMGDAVEEVVFALLERSGVGFVRPQSKKDSADMSAYGLGNVRADGFVQDGDHVIPVEVKSMSDYAFERLERGEIDQAYEWQCEVYCRAYNAPFALLVGYCKSTSHLAELVIHSREARWEAIQAAIATAKGDVCPDRPYAASDACEGCDGRGTTLHAKPRVHAPCGGTGKDPEGATLRYPCSYCVSKTTCWADVGPVEMTLKGDKPRWFVRPKGGGSAEEVRVSR